MVIVNCQLSIVNYLQISWLDVKKNLSLHLRIHLQSNFSLQQNF